MYIKFRESEEIYNVSVSVPVWRSVVRLDGPELPTEPGDFDIYNDENIIIDHFEGFNTIYDSGENFIEFTDDCGEYKVYLNTDEDGCVTSTFITDEPDCEHEGYLYISGTGKKYKFFEMDLFNEEGFPLYKIVDGELVETSEEDRATHHESFIAEKLVSVKAVKIAECSVICNNAIVAGVEIDGEFFSYNEEDQVNIKEIFDLAVQTNVPMFYHANGESCKLYTVDKIIALYTAATTNKMHHITYFNQLKLFINSLESIEEVEAVVYGQELVGEYLKTYSDSMLQAKVVLEALLAIRAASMSE